MVKAIISDLDGTLLPRNHKTVSDKNIESLHRAGEAGITRIIATGRSLFSFNNLIPDNFPIDYLVFSSGAGVMRWSDKSMLETHYLKAHETSEIASYLREYAVNFTIHQKIPHSHYFYYTRWEPMVEDFRQRLITQPNLGTLIRSENDTRHDATQLILVLEEQQTHLYERIHKELPGYSVIRATSPLNNKAIWVEIFAKNVNKGTACEHLLHDLNISFTECAGLGNDYNDLDFLSRCQYPFFVDNTPEPLRSTFNTVKEDLFDGFSEFEQIITHAQNRTKTN